MSQHEHPTPGPEWSTDLPCPPWCELPHGHPFDPHPIATPAQLVEQLEPLTRIHRRTFGTGPTAVVLGRIEHALSTDGPTDPSAATTELWVDHAAELTPAQARELARNLTAAVDLSDQLDDDPA